MIAFVILHYQALEETVNCVNSIRKNVHDEKKIIIVDNNSPNGTGKKIKAIYREANDIFVVLNENNSGFAKGNNIGYEKAKEYSPDYIVVLNSDTLLTKDDFIEQLNKAFEKYNYDVLGPDIFSTKTNSHQNPQRNENYTLDELNREKRKLVVKNNLKFLLKIKYLFFKESLNEKCVKEPEINVQIGKVLHGAFYVFSKKFIEKHNECFYNETFLYYESYILHYLGQREGMVFLYYPEIKILHHEDVSTDMTYKTQFRKLLNDLTI